MTNQIIRTKHNQNHPYVMLSKKTIGLKISLGAKGLWMVLMAKPDNWKVNIDCLRRELGIGRDKIYKLLNELIAAGLCRREQSKVKGENGDWRFGNITYTIYEEKQENPSTDSFGPVPDFPDTENPEALKNKDIKDIEREKAKADEEISSKNENALCPEKEKLFDQIVSCIPNEIIPHEDILNLLSRADITNDDVIVGLDFVNEAISRDQKRKKIVSPPALLISKVFKLRDLRIKKEKKNGLS